MGSVQELGVRLKSQAERIQRSKLLKSTRVLAVDVEVGSSTPVWS
jgi:hypothetical protein